MSIIPAPRPTNEAQELIDFRKYLYETTEIVRTWPVWKQTLLGGPPMKRKDDDDARIGVRLRSKGDVPTKVGDAEITGVEFNADLGKEIFVIRTFVWGNVVRFTYEELDEFFSLGNSPNGNLIQPDLSTGN
jgi:hypothetical protein